MSLKYTTMEEGIKYEQNSDIVIKPAIPKNIKTFEYEDYQPQDKYHYIKKTKIWSKRFVK